MRLKTKAFDALVESREWRERVSRNRKIAKMTPSQELAHFNRRRSVIIPAKKH